MTQSIPLDTRLAGRERDALMPADVDMPCRIDVNREVFDDVIDRFSQVTMSRSEGKTKSYRFAIAAAKAVCAGCPVQLKCLEVHGRDFELGVVGGMTDDERAALFGGMA